MKFNKLNSRGVAHHFALALLVVGIVSAGTLHAINSHALTASASVSIKNPKLCTSAQPSVSAGQKSSCVAYLQSRIGASVDGQYGPGTTAKVAGIQKANKLKDTTGTNVGPCTWGAINHAAIPASCKATGVSASASTKVSPLVYCTYYLNPGHRKVEDARISLAACRQHGGTARSTPTPVSKIPVTYRPSNLPGYKKAVLSISNGNNNITDKLYSSDTYELCTTAYQINTRGVPSSISLSAQFSINLASDPTFSNSKITINNETKCRKMKVTLYKLAWDHVNATIKAGANTAITSAYFKADKNDHTWSLTLTDALPN
jgi:peptidoglycan hydrolase-like protein with peptidoglycan-binding domain